MTEPSGESSGGIGFLGALALLFTALRLLHVTEWSWVWVLSPIWIPIVATCVIIGVIEFWK